MTNARFWVSLVVLIASCCGEKQRDSDSDIYCDVVKSLRQFKAHQLAEKLGIQKAGLFRAPQSVCYDELGCFEINGTFKHLKILPDTPENVATQFLLYTKRNPQEPQIIDYKKPLTLLESNLDKNRPVKVITHGFGGRYNLTWLWKMKSAFLATEDVNVIAVDWSLGAQTPYYIAAVVNTELVGRQIAALLFFLKDKYKIQEKDMHVIGFSLGAQVMGFVGKRMMALRGTRPGRVTGLDPASPLFEDNGGEVHLYKDDGDFVDIIHTNADLLVYGGMGMGALIGDADYFPNGGKRQPGCGSTITGAFQDIFTGNKDRACNHERAVHLYIESILKPSQCRFISYPCTDYSEFEDGSCIRCNKEHVCGEMGYRAFGTGTYYLMTTKGEPFCGESIKIEVTYAKNQKKSFGLISLALMSGENEAGNVTLTKKDEKLLPDGEVRRAAVLTTEIQSIKEIHVKYDKFNGWILKGTDSWNISAISIFNKNGNLQFKSCSKEIELKDSELVQIPAKKESCSQSDRKTSLLL